MVIIEKSKDSFSFLRRRCIKGQKHNSKGDKRIISKLIKYIKFKYQKTKIEIDLCNSSW